MDKLPFTNSKPSAAVRQVQHLNHCSESIHC